ncbi:MAG: dicarboxylate/amino acid:cation symporter [Spirochaetes bacterium]|nr:dicarboxylate/amino acid:cation symporter [Spirochaetota bacterium]
MKKFPLWAKIFIGFGIGLVAGIILKVAMGENAAAFSTTWIKPVGTIFINLIKMLIVPLIFSSLFVGAASIGDPKKLGRVGGKTIAFYLVTTLFAVIIGILMATILQPGALVSAEFTKLAAAKEVTKTSLATTLINLVPKNPVAALSSGNILQIIVFALFSGIAASLIGEKGQPVIKVMNSCAEIMYKITAFVMELAPFGVCALIINTICNQGLSILAGLAIVIAAVYLGSIIHAFFVYGTLVKTIGKFPILKFFKGILPAQIIAFSTTSSSGTLPATIECNENNLGVSKSISSFVLPLGATINMDGTSLYQGVCALFIAQIFGIDLTVGQIITIILTATLASIGTAGVPGAGLIMLSLVLSSVGLPMEGVAIIAGIDRILDMARTTLNITGDSAVNLIVAQTEGEMRV